MWEGKVMAMAVKIVEFGPGLWVAILGSRQPARQLAAPQCAVQLVYTAYCLNKLPTPLCLRKRTVKLGLRVASLQVAR